MRKSITLFLILAAISAGGREITPSEASSVASEFFGAVNGVGRKSPVSRVLTDGGPMSVSQPYYVFNADDNRGFVIVSGDDRAQKILGYSDKGSFDFDNMPPQLAGMLAGYSERLKSVSAGAEPHPSWSTATVSGATGGEVVLETAEWGQGAPYNAFCPVIGEEHAPTGCVATAMAIVMKYHGWPESYNWTAMPSGDVDADNSSEIAGLMADIGLAVDMSYGKDMSSAVAESVRYAFTEKFSYSNAIQFLRPKYQDYELLSASQQIAAIKGQIDKGLLCLMSGESDGISHMFVCDGYKDDLIHINWGWDGINNGYFNLAPLGDMVYQNDRTLLIEINRAQSKYARVFIDSSTDYDRRMGVGLNVRNKEIKAGESVEFVLASFGAPLDFEGKVTLALVDKNGEIKELINESNFNEASYIINQSERDRLNITTKYHRFYWDSRQRNFTFRGPIAYDDRLCVVAQEADSQEWLPVPCTITTSNSCSVSSNTPQMANLDYEVPDGARVSSDPVIPEDHSVLVGQVVDFGVLSKEGLPEFDMRGYQTIFICSSGGIEVTTGEYYATSEFSVFGTSEVKIDISLARFEDLITKEVVLTQYNTLAEKLSLTELSQLGCLTIKGKLSLDDYCWLVANARNLRNLDIKDTDLETISTAPTWLTCFGLPSGLKSISSMAFSGKGLTLASLVLPSSLVSVDANAFYQAGGVLSNIISLSPTPPVIDEDAFKEFCESYYYNTCRPILIVPTDSKERYSQAPGWSCFSLICESSLVDTSFKKVSANGYEYDLIAGIGRIKSLPWAVERLMIPEILEIEGLTYDIVTVEVPLESTQLSGIERKIKYLRIPANIKTVGFDCFADCHDLKVVDIAEGVEQLEFCAFGDCSNLEILHLPSSISYIGENCFQSCYNLNSIFYDTTTPVVANENIFENEVYHNATLQIPEGSADIFYGITPWNKFLNFREIDFSGVDDLVVAANQKNDIYNLQGICVCRGATQADIDGLPSGVYIIQGRKILVGK